MKSIIRNYLAKLAAGRTDDGIMITLPDPKKINFQEAMIQDLLMRNGVDPNAITSEEMLKSILNQIDMASKQTAPSGIRGTRSAQVLDMEGQTIPPGSKIMGGKTMETEAEIAARLQKGNQDSIQKLKMQKMIDDAIDDASPGFADGDTKYDAELVAENLAERMGLVYDDLPTKQRLDLYDQAYRGLSKQRFKNQKTPKGDDPEEKAMGGRIGYAEGTPSFEEYLKERQGIEKKENFERLYKEYLEDLRRKEVMQQKQEAADGGRIGYFMGSPFPKGLATLRQMLQYMGKKSDRVTNPSDVLKMVNPKSLNAMLEDPRLQGKVNVKEGILASDMVKGFQSKMGEDRVQLVKDMLSAAKNIKGADTSQIKLKNEMIEDMMKKGIDRQMAEEMATTMSRLAEDMTGKFKDTPKLTDEGILELENVLKNMETGGKPKRDLNADGGRIGLKDGMNRRTFLKLLGGLASIPIIGKIVKPLKTVKGIKNVPIIKTDNVPGKPEWFDQLVNKVIIEGDDVSKKLATKDREVVHVKKIDDNNEVTVYQDLETDSIRVEYNSPDNMLEESVDLTYTKTLPDEGAPKGSTDFEVTESGFVGRADGPDDFFIDAEPVGGSSIKDLDSDVSKLKEYATGKKPTMKEFIQNKKRKDKVKRINEGDLDERSQYITDRQGDYVDYDEYASGGIAGMLGE